MLTLETGVFRIRILVDIVEMVYCPVLGGFLLYLWDQCVCVAIINALCTQQAVRGVGNIKGKLKDLLWGVSLDAKCPECRQVPHPLA